jgi:hypothetical protein
MSSSGYQLPRRCECWSSASTPGKMVSVTLQEGRGGGDVRGGVTLQEAACVWGWGVGGWGGVGGYGVG